MELERKSEASRMVSVEGFKELVKAINRLADAVEKPDEAKKWQIVALKELSQCNARANRKNGMMWVISPF